MNPTLFEGQIEGAVHMGLGYALSENFPMKDGFPEHGWLPLSTGSDERAVRQPMMARIKGYKGEMMPRCKSERLHSRPGNALAV